LTAAAAEGQPGASLTAMVNDLPAGWLPNPIQCNWPPGAVRLFIERQPPARLHGFKTRQQINPAQAGTEPYLSPWRVGESVESATASDPAPVADANRIGSSPCRFLAGWRIVVHQIGYSLRLANTHWPCRSACTRGNAVDLVQLDMNLADVRV
jgi:hypothetical protein